MSCVLWSPLADKLVQQHARDHVERFEHALPEHGARFVALVEPLRVQALLELFDREVIPQIGLGVVERPLDSAKH